MAAHGGVEGLWSDLPSDILSAVYLRCASAYDRARFAAVCLTWRAVAAWHPRMPALPLLLPSTGHGKRDRDARAYSPEDGRALRVPLPWFPWGNRLVGAYDGGWIASVSGSDELLVVNLFTGARAVLISGRRSIRKTLFSKDPLSSGCILAAMTSRSIAFHEVGCPNRRWTTAWYGDLLDIAFCNGKFYALICGKIIVFDICTNEEGAPMTIRVFHVSVAMTSFYTEEDLSSDVKYIFELHGKLAIAVEIEPEGHNCKIGHFFKVFELAKNDDATMSHRYTWVEVTSLGDHALFLGPANCRAMHVPRGCRLGEVEGNRIYYSKQHTYLHSNMDCLARLDMGCCTVHSWENEARHHLERIVSRGYHYRKDQDGAPGCNGCVWLLPPDF